MIPYILAKQGTPEATLFNCFKRVESQGLRCLYLDKLGHGPIRKIGLFYIPIYAHTNLLPLQDYYISVSFIPKSEFSEECYLLEFIEALNGKFYIRSPEKFGCANMPELFEEFLYLSNFETGCLKNLKNNPSKLETENFDWFVDFMKNRLKVRHLGNDTSVNWKYSATKEDEDYYREAFKKLFRNKLTSKDLNLKYAFNLKTQHFDSSDFKSSPGKPNSQLIF